MHQTHRSRSAFGAGLLAFALVALWPSVAEAGPKPGAQRGFRLFAGVVQQFEVNRVSCGINTAGEICVNVSGSSTVPGNVWPRGTPDAYIFNSGLQLAGLIGEDGGPWAGDTTGAFFFDPKGTTQHGSQVTPIFNAQDPADLAAWPEAAYVPDFHDVFEENLQGRPTASQGDMWFMTWDGDPSASAGRSHPLGVVAEVRGLAWNYPTGNEDILYFVFTFYNVTSTNPADYAAIPEARRTILLEQAEEFQALNEAAYGVSLPDEGYTLTNLFAAFAMDADVATYQQNYSSVNLPFALGYSYTGTFLPGDDSWIYPASIFSDPFFPATGFVGVKYLEGPTGEGAIQLWGTTLNQGAFDDAQNVIQLYRYLSGNVSPAAGDQACTYNPQTSHICYVAPNQFDTRFFQSSPALTLGPGEFGNIVVAYVFAPPVALPGLAASATTDVKPGDPRLINDLANLTGGGDVNRIDSITGYLDYLGDLNSNGEPDQDEFEVVPGSLLGKSLVAQLIFDNGFLLPGAPETPEFFLVPGDDQVTVIWQRSATEATGDPYFSVVGDAFSIGEGGDPVPNLLYDPSYREFDVEGYRVYRGRVDNPSELELLAQFDYGGTEILDFGGYINPTSACYLPLGLACDFVEFGPGIPADPAAAEHEPLAGNVVQVRPAGVSLLADSTILVTSADTAVTGAASGSFPALEDTGVPFLYVDNEVRNGVRYFYSVTAFDVNSFISGNSSLESARVTKAVTPRKSATNVIAGAEATGIRILGGDGTELTDAAMPTIDPATGTFSKAFPPARDSWELGLGSLAAADVLAPGPGSFQVRIDSIRLGSASTDSPTDPAIYHLTVTSSTGSVYASLPILQSYTSGLASGAADFAAVPIDPDLAAEFGGGAGYALPGRFEMSLPGAYYTNIHGRGCINHAAGFAPIDGNPSTGCAYNGSRWFEGANETTAHPTAGNLAISSFPVKADNFNNAGTLAGVTTIYESRSYNTSPFWWRIPESMLGAAVRASDIQLTWGPGGTITSVRDLTYNVDVPFDSTAGGGWGFMNLDDQNVAGSGDFFETHATIVDVLACVPPFNSLGAVTGFLGGCGAAGQFYLSDVAVPSAVAYASGGTVAAPMNYGQVSGGYLNFHPAAQDGLVLYIAGHLYTFELAGGALPADGTVWTMRSYSGGVVNGGQGLAGDQGPYTYVQQQAMPFTAVGASIEFNYEVTNQVNPVTEADLADVHTVPDPYYVTNALEQTTEAKVLQFVNLPQRALVRIYSSSGVLVDVIEHESSTNSSVAVWDLRNRNEQVVASGVYFYHVEAAGQTKIGKFTVVNFAR